MKITKPLSEPKKYFFLLLAIGWTVFIGVLCLIDSKSLPKIGAGIDNFDKFVHMFMHFVFTVLWSGYLISKHSFGRRQAVKVVLASLSYGLAIELAQALFTTTRKADILDVCANSLGMILALLTIFALLKGLKN